ncbi:uncharacterized protein B4U80_07110 [Leptotrombidium deliense]|uniref:NADP-dependent oxidoreductase domain-containing protein n=1 Tax=Leptotrombidium deliense TaxID=299467 RepID=A0A443S6X9_9ACAR|nr:uncharacterized protein B4U80_07110 [Leptotrombidium deliense]
MSKLIKMSNGKSIPTVGLGTWKSKPGEVYAAVKSAILDAGYRHIDCALVYGNEHEVGIAINEVIAKGTVKRDDLFITSKVWNNHHSRSKVMECCKESLSKLKLAYVDLYLVHWPFGFKEGGELFPRDADGKLLHSDIDYIETYKGMEDCFNAGLVKSIGLSNFNSEQIKRVMDSCTVKPVMNQVEGHAYLNQSKLMKFCEPLGIKLTAYSPLGSPDRPDALATDPILLNDPKIAEIAKKRKKTSAQVLIRYLVQRGIAVVPKSVSTSRMKANIEVFDFELTAEDMKTIDGLDRNYRYIAFKDAKDHKYYPFSIPNGISVPTVGLGTWKSKPGEVYAAVKYAIEEAGYRHIDCALAYQNEDEVGKAINETISKGIVKREDLFITTKCWNTYHSRNKVMECCKESLSKLKLEYVDLYLIHWPMGFKEGGELFPKDADDNILYSDIDYLETYKGMEDCFNSGLIKSIGLSNFNSEQIKRVLDACTVKPVMNQVECHPYNNQTKLINFCEALGITITAYSPLGTPDRPWAAATDPSLLEEPKLEEIAKKYNKSTAQVLIRYQVQRGVVVIPKSVTPARIKSNIEVFDFELNADDMIAIDGFERGYRFLQLAQHKKHPYYPFSIPF